ncbi:hypothetical protein C0L76_02990 [Clostridium perfringens]
MCIFCYLDNYKQYKVRKGIQLRCDRFEHTLNKYKLSFISKFNSNLEEKLCEEHNTEYNKEILNCLKNINIKDIDDFFEELINIYISWINSQPKIAIESLEELLSKKDILSFKVKMDGKVLFRGRNCNSFLSHWDMFHIPFNRRFLIGNQRYSLVGQPLLYLATSPYCVFKELGGTEDIKISSFRMAYNDTKENNLIFFNNSNNFNNLIETKEQLLTNSKLDSLICKEVDNNLIEKSFFQFILYSCCSFSKKSFKTSYFCEEYVLPQILSQVIKSHNNNEFQGIVFDSTRCFDDEKLATNHKVFDSLCKNICVFTNYDSKESTTVGYVYDKVLYEKFSISATLSYEHSSVETEYYSTEKSLKLVNSLLSKQLDNYHNNLLYEINDYIVTYENIIINSIDNFISKENKDLFMNSMNLHNLLLRNIILNVCDDLN